MLAFAIILATVLFLVDKNRVWRQFWKVSLVVTVAAILSVSGFIIYQHHVSGNASQVDEFAQYKRHK